MPTKLTALRWSLAQRFLGDEDLVGLAAMAGEHGWRAEPAETGHLRHARQLLGRSDVDGGSSPHEHRPAAPIWEEKGTPWTARGAEPALESLADVNGPRAIVEVGDQLVGPDQILRRPVYAKRLTNASDTSATSRHPSSIVSA